MSFCEPAKNGSPKIANLRGILMQVGKISSLGTVLDRTMFERIPPTVQTPAKMPRSLRFFQYFFLNGSGTISGLPIMNWMRFSGVILLSCCIIQGLISQALGDFAPLAFFSSALLLDILTNQIIFELEKSSKKYSQTQPWFIIQLLALWLMDNCGSTMLIISHFQYWCYLVFDIITMRMLSRPSCFATHVLPFKKYSYAFAYDTADTWRDSNKNVPLKAYQKLLLGDDLGQLPKLPTVKLLDSMRSRQISRIMLFNHELNHEQVFESQIECFYSMVSRFEPSIQSMSLLLQQIYKNLSGLNSEYPQSRLQAQKRALVPVMKPSLLSKLVHISHVIEPYYNEYLKMMLTTFFVRSILFSESSVKSREQQKGRLDRLRKEVYKKEKELFVQGEKITREKYAEYFQTKGKELSRDYPCLELQDFLQASHYILSNEYYTEQILNVVVNKLEKYGLQDQQNLVLTILKIKLLGVLHKFQNFRAVQVKKAELFQTIYNQNITRYFSMISSSQQLFQIANSQSQILQLHLIVTEFLSNEHFNKAKDLYYNIIYEVFDTNSNGCLLSDIKKVRGLFEIILIMYSHRDTKRIHELLKKIEKTLVLYPFIRMQKFQTYVYACQKFGYKSDVVAERYLNTQIQTKQRLASLKGIIPHLHQLTRQMNLARKFLTYLEIVDKGTKEQLELAHRYASELFDPNIWYCLSQNQANAYTYFTTPSFNSFLYFTKVSINNLTSGLEEKKKIDYMAQKINLININKKHNLILHTTTETSRLTPIKLVHSSFWRHNHHSRMLSTLKLAVHQYKHLQRRDPKEATSFIEQFLQKTINNPAFYNVFKFNMSYPGIFEMMLQIMQYVNPKQYPIQTRDLQALKKLFTKNLQKLKKMQQSQLSRETEKIKYQPFLDAVEYNIIYLPYLQEHYGLTGIILNLENSLTYDSIVRYKSYKQNLRMQIQTFCKFRKQNDIEVIVNYLQYPYIADVLIKKKESAVVLMIKISDDPQQSIVNHRQLDLHRNAEQYWKKKGYPIIYLRSKKQIEQFVDVKIREVVNRLQEQKI